MKINVAIILSSFFYLGLSQAHIKEGIHTGISTEGSLCEMNVGKTYFEKNEKHPLNERIEISVNGEKFTVQHPPVISTQDKLAFFDHDYFHGILPNKSGAKALVIKMQHTDTKEGPIEFHVINHDYKADKREIFSCKLN